MILDNNCYNEFAPTATWQLEAWKDKNEVILLCGTAGSGKTRLALEKCNALAITHPNSSILFVKKTYNQLHGSLLVPFEQSVLGPLLYGSRPIVRKNQNHSCYYYQNGSVIFYAGMANEKERQRIRGIGKYGGLDYIFMDEGDQFLKDDYEELMGRLRGNQTPFQQMIICTNPNSPGHWLYKELVLKKQASYYFSTYKDNAHNPANYESRLNRMSGSRLARLKEGKWTSAEGNVYDFDPDVHVIEPFLIPLNWPRICSIDFGYKAPFVCQFWAIDPDGAMYLYREIYQTHLLVEDAAKLIKYLARNERVRSLISDHDAEDRATLAKYGLPTIEAVKEISPGIQAVQSRLKIGPNDKPRMFFFANALHQIDTELKEINYPTSTIEEFGGYVWDKNKSDQSFKEVPIKRHDHGMDAMRYATMYVDAALGFISGSEKKARQKLVLDLEKTFAKPLSRPSY